MPKHQELTQIVQPRIISDEEPNKTRKLEAKGFMTMKFHQKGFAQQYQREKCQAMKKAFETSQ